jgi:hypothetical protein
MLIEELEKMKDEELIALTEEDIERIVMYNIADQGIPIEIEPQYEPLDNVKQPSHSFYKSGLFANLLFPSAGAVESMNKLAVELGLKREGYEYSFDHNPVFLDFEKNEWGNIQENSVVTNNYYSKGEYVDLSVVLAKNKRIGESNKNKREKYEKYVSSINGIRGDIECIIQEAHSRIYTKKQEEEKFKTYVEISKGDYDIAMAFYMKANGNDADMKKHIDIVYGRYVPVCEDVSVSE